MNKGLKMLCFGVMLAVALVSFTSAVSIDSHAFRGSMGMSFDNQYFLHVYTTDADSCTVDYRNTTHSMSFDNQYSKEQYKFSYYRMLGSQDFSVTCYDGTGNSVSEVFSNTWSPNNGYVFPKNVEEFDYFYYYSSNFGQRHCPSSTKGKGEVKYYYTAEWNGPAASYYSCDVLDESKVESKIQTKKAAGFDFFVLEGEKIMKSGDNYYWISGDIEMSVNAKLLDNPEEFVSMYLSRYPSSFEYEESEMKVYYDFTGGASFRDFLSFSVSGDQGVEFECSLDVDNVEKESWTLSSGDIVSDAFEFSNGVHNWTLNCVDNYGFNLSEDGKFEVDVADASSKSIYKTKVREVEVPVERIVYRDTCSFGSEEEVVINLNPKKKSFFERLFGFLF